MLGAAGGSNVSGPNRRDGLFAVNFWCLISEGLRSQ
jgi:hypothetical protein